MFVWLGVDMEKMKKNEREFQDVVMELLDIGAKKNVSFQNMAFILTKTAGVTVNTIAQSEEECESLSRICKENFILGLNSESPDRETLH